MATTALSREEKLAIYDKLVLAHKESERKGDTIPYTSLNGHMYSMMTKGDEVALRLPEAERAPFIAKHNSKLVEQYGIVQKEWVVVPDSVLKKTVELKKYFEMANQYVSAKKPKPATKTKKKL